MTTNTAEHFARLNLSSWGCSVLCCTPRTSATSLLRAKIGNLAFALLLLAPTALAQGPATGTPGFGSYTAGPDVTNLGNLNVHYTFRVFSKPGRGLPFNYALSYDSSVWYPATVNGQQNWQPVSNWGWSAQTDTAVGWVQKSSARISCRAFIGRWVTEYYTKLTYSGYTDSFGSYHKFSRVLTDYVPAPDCGPIEVTDSSSTADGSGYTGSLDGANDFTLTNRNGALINAPFQKGLNSAFITDDNGNQITTTGSAFTDTLGMTALSISGTNPMVYTYTDSNNASQQITVNYATYTVQTNFGCASPQIAEYGPLAQSLVSSIVYPDGSSYSFTYEPTPGAPANVTGRLASVKLPTGGYIVYASPAPTTALTAPTAPPWDSPASSAPTATALPPTPPSPTPAPFPPPASTTTPPPSPTPPTTTPSSASSPGPPPEAPPTTSSKSIAFTTADASPATSSYAICPPATTAPSPIAATAAPPSPSRPRKSSPGTTWKTEWSPPPPPNTTPPVAPPP